MGLKKVFLSKGAKAFVDILLIVVLILSWKFADVKSIAGNYWFSSHCIMGVLWSLLIMVHVWQHWRFIKALTKKKVASKNKITAITTVVFVLMVLSILLFAVGFNHSLLKFHHVIGHFFALFIIVHLIDKWKPFVRLFKKVRS